MISIKQPLPFASSVTPFGAQAPITTQIKQPPEKPKELDLNRFLNYAADYSG